MKEIKTFSDIIQTVKNLPSSNLSQKNKARDYQLTLTKPPGSLGLLEELAIDLCSWQNKLFPELKNVKTLIFAGNHGICDQGVNAFPQSVTQQMVSNFQNGGAAINQLCKVAGSDLQVIPIDLENPTKDISKNSAMNETELLAYINIGINSIDKNSDIIILGEMGIGNSTIAAAINYACFGGNIIDWVGMGTSSSNSIIEHKVSVIEQATSINKPQNPIEILMNLGGKEMDLRKGGFVPIGKKERADDVPARLSKNEFVMTADAVRAAGGGSVNKGAKRMYETMNKLEARA